MNSPRVGIGTEVGAAAKTWKSEFLEPTLPQFFKFSLCPPPNKRLSPLRPEASTRSAIALAARSIVAPSRSSAGATVRSTNAKPRDEFVGLRRLATFCGLSASRHRDVCRPVVTGLKVGVSEVSSIALPSIHGFSHVVISSNYAKLSHADSIS
jgi:hypothetical protein